MIPEKYLKTTSQELIQQGQIFFKKSKLFDFKVINNFISGSFIDDCTLVEVEIFLRENTLKSKCTCSPYGSLCKHSLVILMHYYNTKDKEVINIQKNKEYNLKYLMIEHKYKANLLINMDNMPHKKADLKIKVQIIHQGKKYSSKYLSKIMAGMLIKNISMESFSWQDRSLIDFFENNCATDNPIFIIPNQLIHTFLQLLINHLHFYSVEKKLNIKDNSLKLHFDINKQKKSFVINFSWFTKKRETIKSYFITNWGVWVELEDYYYFPFHSNRSLIMNLLKLKQFVLSKKEFEIFNRNICEIKHLIKFNIKSNEAQVVCKPVLQLNWRNLVLEAYIGFEYMGKITYELESYIWVKDSYVKRSLIEEEQAHNFLKNMGFVHQEKNYFLLKNLQQVGFFIDNYYKNLVDNWLVFTTEIFKQKLLLSKKLSVNIKNISNNNNWFEFDLELSVDKKKIEQWKKILFTNNTQQNNYLTFDDGRLMYIDDQDYKVLNQLKNKSEGHYKFSQYMVLPFLNLMKPYVDNEKILEKLCDKIINIKKKEKDIKNSDLNQVLRDYQQDGVRWLQKMHKNKFNCILADEMGLGKTIQALIFIATFKKKTKTLIISPKSLTENWKNEAKRFTPKFKSVIISSYKDKEDKQEEISKANLVIISYRLLQFEIDFFSEIKFDFIILDEAQYVKNHNSVTMKACHQLKTNFKLLLTGTPIENSLMDIWALFQFILPGFLGSVTTFRNNFIKNKNTEEINRLARIIDPFILRRYKKDVLSQLPPKQEQILICNLSEEQEKIYQSYLYQIKKNYASGENRLQIFTSLLKLKQICCTPELIIKGKKIESAKFELFKQLVMQLQESSHKVLVFSQFTSMLAIIREWIDTKGISYLYLDGKTKNRQKLVDKFNETAEIKFFLISLKAGGVGLNLTGSDTVIHYDLWWNPMVEDQATDRAHRIGQTKKVNIIKLITKNTIEEKIMQIQNSKRKLFYSMLENPHQTGGLTKEDFEFLLGD